MYSRKASTVDRLEALRAGLKTARIITITLKATVMMAVSVPIVGVPENWPPTALMKIGFNARLSDMPKKPASSPRSRASIRNIRNS